MGRENEATTKFKVDISELKSEIRQANRQIRLANAEFQAAAASMENWEKSTKGVEKKLESLNKMLSAEEAKLESLNRQHKLTVEQYGANSAAAQELEIKIKKQEAAVNKTKKQVGDYRKKLSDLEEESRQAECSVEDLSGAFDDTEETAGRLKKKVGELKDGFTIFKGVVADLAADGVRRLVSGFKDLMTASDKAHNSLQAQTGASAAEMEKLNAELDEIYESGAGDSLEDIADAMAVVKQQTKEVDPSKLKEMTENAIVLRDTFGMDVADSVRTANMLMKKFGITSEEAYNLIVQGAQSGLDQNGNLLDTINEYGPKFQQMGFTAEEMFNSLANGAKNGVYDLDKLGDAVNEFSIRVKDGTADNAFKDLGLDVAATSKAFGKGGDAAKAAFRKVLTALKSVEDPLKRNRLGVELFGTMWEDTGGDCILALSEMQGELKATEKAMQKVRDVKYEDIGTQFAQVGRTIQTDILVPIAKKVLPAVKEFVTWTKNNLSTLVPVAASAGAAIGTIFVVNKVTKFITSVKTLITTFKGLSTAIKTAQAAQGLLSKAMTVVSNPYVLAIAGAGAMVTVLALLSNALDEEKQRHKKSMEAIQKKQEAYDKLLESQEENIRAETGNIDYASRLVDELLLLADASGKVEEKDRARAETILGIVNEALGTEYRLIDGQIQKYDELSKTIDDVIAKKRAQIILDSQEEAYRTAIENINAETESLRQMQEQYAEAEKYISTHDLWANANMKDKEYLEAQEKLKHLGKEIEAQTELVEDYMASIAGYESDYQNIMEGTADSLAKVNSRVKSSTDQTTKTVAQSLKQQISNTETALARWENLYKKTGNEIYKNQIASERKRLENLKTQLKEEQSTRTRSNSMITEAAERMGEDLNRITKNTGFSSTASVKQTVKDMEGQIRGAGFLSLMKSKMDELKSGITSKQGTVKSSMLGVVSAAISALKSGDYRGAGSAGGSSFASGLAGTKGSAKQSGKEVAQSGKSGMEAVKSNKSGENFGYGYGNGMWNTRSFVYNIGWKIAQMALQGLRDGQDEHSPAKESAKSGDNFVLGYVNKIRAGIRLAKQAGSDLAKAAVSSLGSGTMEMKAAVGSAAYSMQSGTGSGDVSGGFGGTVYNQYFTQNNYSPKSLSRLEIYRQTHNALQFAKGG